MATYEEISFGGDSLMSQKLETIDKYNSRTRKMKKCIGRFIFSACSIGVSWFVLFATVKHSLQVKIQEMWVVCGSQGFIFFLLNLIVVVLSVKSGMFISSGPQKGNFDFYEEFIKKSAENNKNCKIVDSAGQSSGLTDNLKTTGAIKNYEDNRSDNMKMQRVRKSSRSDRGGKNACEGICSWKVGNNGGNKSDEELERRVEEFIANFKRQLRLQKQQFCDGL